MFDLAKAAWRPGRVSNDEPLTPASTKVSAKCQPCRRTNSFPRSSWVSIDALPDASFRTRLPNLLPILSNPINWNEIEQQYDEMVKYAAAMQTRTADPEAILRCFARAEVMHLTYKVLSELGWAVKTIFLCRYLR